MSKFIVCFQRPQGEARTYALGADDALKFAISIQDSEEGIMVESVETGDRWTVEQFKAIKPR